MVWLVQTTTKTRRCAIVFAHMTNYVIQNGTENADGRRENLKERSPSKPQGTQDYALRSSFIACPILPGLTNFLYNCQFWQRIGRIDQQATASGQNDLERWTIWSKAARRLSSSEPRCVISAHQPISGQVHRVHTHHACPTYWVGSD